MTLAVLFQLSSIPPTASMIAGDRNIKKGGLMYVTGIFTSDSAYRLVSMLKISSLLFTTLIVASLGA
jgi:hypothetical protein